MPTSDDLNTSLLSSGLSEASNIISRIATLEARFTGLEQKSDRIEGILTQLLNKSNESAVLIDARIEKEVTDKLDPIKDWLRSDRTKIETLEAGKRYNLATIAVVGAFLFGIFTYYSNQQNESAKQLVISQAGLLKNEFLSTISTVKGELAAGIASNANTISSMKALVDKTSIQDSDYQAFKGLVTSQNATSIVDRNDQRRDIQMNQSTANMNASAVATLTAKVEQKLAEIETQFNADGQLRNVQFSEQQRWNATAQNSLHELGGKIPEYPTGPFYQPNISQTYKDGY